MTAHPRPPRPRAVAALLTLVLTLAGCAAANAQPGSPTAQPAPTASAVPAPQIARIVIPDDATLAPAAAAVSAALVQRGLPAPAISHGDASAGPGTLAVRFIETFAAAGDTFLLDDADGGLLVEAASPAGAAAGLATVAQRIRAGTQLLPPGERGRFQSPSPTG